MIAIPPIVRMGRTGGATSSRKSHWCGIMIYRGWTPLISTNRPPFHDALPGRREMPVGARSGATGFGLPPSRRPIREPGDLPYVPGAEPFQGREFRCQHGGCRGTRRVFGVQTPFFRPRRYSADSRRCAGAGIAHVVVEFPRCFRPRRRALRQIQIRRITGFGNRPRTSL